MIVRFVRSLRLAVLRIKFMGRLKRNGTLIVGSQQRVARGASLTTADTVSIGNACSFMANVSLGDNVMVSSNVAFIGDDHPFQDLDGPITGQSPNPFAAIVIEGDSLIGFGSILVGPLTVRRGAVIAAGAVVTHDTDPESVVGGVPAREITQRRRPSGRPSAREI